MVKFPIFFTYLKKKHVEYFKLAHFYSKNSKFTSNTQNTELTLRQDRFLNTQTIHFYGHIETLQGFLHTTAAHTCFPFD